jgi:Acetoacetate decarboxylase (ADC)
MLKGYTLPLTPKGTSSLAPMPPWHYVGTCLAIEYEADPDAVASFLPPGLEFHSPQCAVYFSDWQYASETGEEYLDPIRSQYHEMILLISAAFQGNPCAYCPLIWVDQDVALMRGLTQGWPKQIGSIWITRSFDLPSKAGPLVGPGGKFGATLAVKDRRLFPISGNVPSKSAKSGEFAFPNSSFVEIFPSLLTISPPILDFHCPQISQFWRI